jgi:ribosomal protein S18 acetylase RimI-like enzyme
VGAFGLLLDWILARHLEIAAAQGPVDHARTASISTLDDIPDCALPAGIEVRPVEREQSRRIWEAETEAFAGHWGAGADNGSEERWQEFLADPFTDLPLWQVARDGDQIVGMVRPFINDDENAHFGVRRGWCENISTRAPWRGRGVASALISRALRALRDRSMTQAALGVDAQNETGALHLYTRMGFREAARETEWRRPLFLDGSRATEAGA